MSDAKRAGSGPLSARALQQYAALAAMRWRMFWNGLRSNKGMLELGARTLSYLVYAGTGLGISTGLGFGAYAMLSTQHAQYLPILFWAVFLVWQMLPVLLASFQEQFDLGILLRFPVSFSSYFLLYLIFGLVDVSTITGGLCCLGLWVGTTVARPGLSAWMALALLVFAAFNIFLVRAIFAWIDRWLAQRRTREIVGAVFLLLVMSLQFLNPALHQGRRRAGATASERAAGRVVDQRKAFNDLRPWLMKANAVQQWLPPGLAARAVQAAGRGETEPALDSLALLLMFGLTAGLVLAVRLNAEYAGENLNETSVSKASARGRDAAHRTDGGWLAGGSGPVGAIFEKELRSMMRTLPLLFAIGAPLLMVLVFAGVMVRNGPTQIHTFELALPVCLVYAQLGFTQVFYNNMGAEGAGIQLYFLSPTPFRTVLLAKNIFHTLLFFLVVLTAGVLAGLRMGLPENVVIASSAAWTLFALPCNLAAGNFFSLSMPYRVNPGRLTKQRGSQANQLVSVLVQLGVMAVGSLVFWLCWWFDEKWMTVPIFIALSGIAWAVWRTGLRRADETAIRRRENLIATLSKIG